MINAVALPMNLFSWFGVELNAGAVADGGAQSSTEKPPLSRRVKMGIEFQMKQTQA
jgi:hypothetical protein